MAESGADGSMITISRQSESKSFYQMHSRDRIADACKSGTLRKIVTSSLDN